MGSPVPVIELHDDDLKQQTIITLDDDKNEPKVVVVTLEDDCPVKKSIVSNPGKKIKEILLDEEGTEDIQIDLDSEDAAECSSVVLDDSDIDVSEVITLEDEYTTNKDTNIFSSLRNANVAESTNTHPMNTAYETSADTLQTKPLSTSNKNSTKLKSVFRNLRSFSENVIKKPYVCDFCHETFLEKNVFVAHFKTHNAEKPYVCDICFKAFKDKKILRMHYNTHTGEKPFACTICDKVYSNTVALRKHYKLHTGEKPYVCDVCLTSFDQKSSLCDHKLEKHKFLTVL